MDTVKTERGAFKVRFDNMAQAVKAGFHIWFTENGQDFVTNGESAFAVRKQELCNVDYKTPDGKRGTWLAVAHKFCTIPASGVTASGYGSKLPTSHMLKIDNRWRRVYAMSYSNASTLFISLNRVRYIVDFSL